MNFCDGDKHTVATIEMVPSGGTLNQIVRRIHRLHSLPAVAMRVAELTRKDDVDPRVLRECVEADPAICAKILAVVNGSLAPGARVISLGQAIAMLGVRRLQLLVLGMSLPAGLFNGVESAVLSYYWRFSLYKSFAANRLAQRSLGAEDADATFVIALLHDCGMLAMIQELGAPYLNFLQHILGTAGPDILALESETLGFDHRILGAKLMAEWQLPEQVVELTRQRLDIESVNALPEPTRSMAQAIHVADLLAHFWILRKPDLGKQVARLVQAYWGLGADAIGQQFNSCFGIPDADSEDDNENPATLAISLIEHEVMGLAAAFAVDHDDWPQLTPVIRATHEQFALLAEELARERLTDLGQQLSSSTTDRNVDPAETDPAETDLAATDLAATDLAPRDIITSEISPSGISPSGMATGAASSFETATSEATSTSETAGTEIVAETSASVFAAHEAAPDEISSNDIGSGNTIQRAVLDFPATTPHASSVSPQQFAAPSLLTPRQGIAQASQTRGADAVRAHCTLPGPARDARQTQRDESVGEKIESSRRSRIDLTDLLQPILDRSRDRRETLSLVLAELQPLDEWVMLGGPSVADHMADVFCERLADEPFSDPMRGELMLAVSISPSVIALVIPTNDRIRISQWTSKLPQDLRDLPPMGIPLGTGLPNLWFGVAALSYVPKGFCPSRLIEPAQRCLRVAQQMGGSNIKSIDVL